MTNNTAHDQPPSTWEIGAVDAGDDTYYVIDPADPTPTGVLVWHWCTGHAPGDGPTVDQGRWMAAGVSAHTLVSADPLHLEPSLLWGCCGKHGYIRAGRWKSV